MHYSIAGGIPLLDDPATARPRWRADAFFTDHHCDDVELVTAMGYATSTLADGEVMIRRARFNWTYDFVSWLWVVIGAAFSAFIFLTATRVVDVSNANFGTVFSYASIIGVVLGVTGMLTRYVHKWTTVIAVTSTRLIFKTGVVSRTSHDISIEKIEEVNLHQSLWGRLLGYGHLVVGGEGIGLIELPPIGNPVVFLRDLESAASDRRKRTVKRQLHPVEVEPVDDKPLNRRVRRVVG